ncbi:conserved hypothetical protein [Pseudoclavibacter sp. 8L]|nr:conserved hypothetical protein [Pseudoclavibacter sp. 8L]
MVLARVVASTEMAEIRETRRAALLPGLRVVDVAAACRHHASQETAATIAGCESAAHRACRTVRIDLDQRALEGIGEDALELGRRVDEAPYLRSRNGGVAVQKGRTGAPPRCSFAAVAAVSAVGADWVACPGCAGCAIGAGCAICAGCAIGADCADCADRADCAVRAGCVVSPDSVPGGCEERLSRNDDRDLRLDRSPAPQLLRRRAKEAAGEYIRAHLVQRAGLGKRILAPAPGVRRAGWLVVATIGLAVGGAVGVSVNLRLSLTVGIGGAARVRVGSFPRGPPLGVADDERLPGCSVEDRHELRVGVDDRQFAEAVLELREHHPSGTAGSLEALVERLLRQLLGDPFREGLDSTGGRRDGLLEHHARIVLSATLELSRVGMRDAQTRVDDHQRMRAADGPSLHRLLNGLETIGDRIRSTEFDLHRPLRPARNRRDLGRERPNLQGGTRGAGELVAAEPQLERTSVQLGLLAVEPIQVPLVVGKGEDKQRSARAKRAIFGALAGVVDDALLDTEPGREAPAHLTKPSRATRRRDPRSLVVDRFVLHACIVSRTTDIL